MVSDFGGMPSFEMKRKKAMTVMQTRGSLLVANPRARPVQDVYGGAEPSTNSYYNSRANKASSVGSLS